MKLAEATETRKLDEYLRDHAGIVGEIATDLRVRGVTEAAFDDLVHDAADKLGKESSDWASNLNNSHVERQVAFVLQENGKAEGRKLIEEAALEWLAESAPTPAA